VNGGTIFLDEIGELPMGTQARLLRVLETGEFIRVGSSKVQKTNVRVIAATNRELLDHASAGKFREDLYYRLSTVPIRVPSLRDRKEDIPLLFRKFANDFSERYRTQAVQLDAGAQQLLVNYPWPGNVRELKNIAEQVSVLSTDKNVTAEVLSGFLPKRLQQLPAPMLPTVSHAPNTSGADSSSTERDILYKLFFDLKKDMNDIKGALFDMAHGGYQSGMQQQRGASDTLIPTVGYSDSGSNNGYGNVGPVLVQPMSTVVASHEDVEESLSLTDKEKELISKALKKHRGRRRDAANELGISERTLYRKIKEYDIEE
jgi:DNA-binding NtrC family response regulator